MNRDRAHHSGIRLSDPLTVADEPAPGAPEPVTKHAARFLPSTRYRHPGDVIRLIGGGLILAVMLAVVAVAPGRLTGSGAAAVTWLGSDLAGRLLTGLVQVAFVVAAAGAAAAALWHRRFRLLAGLAAGAAAAVAALAGILYLAGDSTRTQSRQRPGIAPGWPAPRFPARPCSPRPPRSPWPQRRG